MKRSIIAIGIAFEVAGTAAAAGWRRQQPEVKLDNRWVRVFHIRLAPHDRTPMHEVSTRLVVWLTDAHLRDSLASGKIQMEEHKAGDVTWVERQRHVGVNLSAKPIEFIAVEVKGTR